MGLRWRGRGRNSKCPLLLLTSASTAVKLDHYDANLRRSVIPGEELWSESLSKRVEKGWSVALGGGGEENIIWRQVSEQTAEYTENQPDGESDGGRRQSVSFHIQNNS